MTKHYIVNRHNIIECQEELIKKGYAWQLEENKPKNPYKFKRKYRKFDKSEILVIHAFDVEGTKYLGWDIFKVIRDKTPFYDFEIYVSKRKLKLNRILNG